jgi:hypothetical protein
VPVIFPAACRGEIDALRIDIGMTGIAEGRGAPAPGGWAG